MGRGCFWHACAHHPDNREALVVTNRYPEWTYSAALAALPLQTPLRLRRLIALGTASHVWDMLQAGERPL